MERTSWIGVIFGEDWEKDVLELSGKLRTKEILISKPVYQGVYSREVRYMSLSFYRSMHCTYFGKEFFKKNYIVPVVDTFSWNSGRKETFQKLIHDLGKPDFYYFGSEFKYNCNKKYKK